MTQQSKYVFGRGSGHLPAKVNKIAKRHGARLVNYTESDGGKRHWFVGPSYGIPRDTDMARAVFDDLEAAGILRKVTVMGL